ncbi:aromatic ring-opening dioxygenase LigA [Actinoplanes xinjiangensis]|uniref:aromatic ring-opening dioxygenase LigA n=1 Tax=Actinoplanes xinjiangensis TaxID=512350 RepID=UPI00343F013B
MNTAPVKANLNGPVKTVRLISLLLMVAGLVVAAAGATTWFTVQSQLADERITVSEDADWFAGEKIDGPLTAYAEAQVIEKHALESSGGKTYAELDREDPARQTVMNGSFLRASLFTSVVSFGIAAMAVGLGIVIALIGYALFLVARRLAAVAQPAN